MTNQYIIQYYELITVHGVAGRFAAATLSATVNQHPALLTVGWVTSDQFVFTK